MARTAAPKGLEIYLLTFNCARTLIDPTLLGQSFFNAWPKTTLPDVVAISLQEVAPIAYSFLGDSWADDYLRAAAQSLQVASSRLVHDIDAYENVVAHHVGMTAAMVFVKRDIMPQVKDVALAGVGVGVWEMGNKGGVGIRLTIDGRKLTFVAMHLAPMEEAVARRNQDWQDICRGLVFESELSQVSALAGPEAEPLLGGAKHEKRGLYDTRGHIFLFGDLNYRTSHLSPTPTAYKTFPQPALPSDSPRNSSRIPLPELLARDQLTQERLEGRVLHGFEEAPITFPPTYKYSHTIAKVPGPQLKEDSAEDDDAAEEEVEVQEPSIWTWARHRWPSWCDRILFYPLDGVVAGKYTALPLLPSSDHRAVALHVTLEPDAHTKVVRDDLRENPPFVLDEHWRLRRAAARRYELAVGVASWFTLTTGGQATTAGLIGGALAIYFLVRVFGQGST